MTRSLDFNILAGLHSSASHEQRQQVLQYFEELKSSNNGWETCAELLLRQELTDDSQKFFCFQVIEYYLKSNYKFCTQQEHEYVKQFFMSWYINFINGKIDEKLFIRNKMSQLFSLAFVIDFPHRWPLFMVDITNFLSSGPKAIDLFLRILTAIDIEVVDREIPHTQEENIRNTHIKDSLRETCFVSTSTANHTSLVETWYYIITTQRPELVCLCLEVISLYVSWIDITLIANERFVTVFLKLIKEPLCRETACTCISAVISKGMPPDSKLQLVESFSSVLASSGVFAFSEDETGDYLSKLGKLVNTMALQILDCYSKLSKVSSAQMNAQRNQMIGLLESKIDICLNLLAHEDDDVSCSVIGSCHDYVTLLKSLRPFNTEQDNRIKLMLKTIISKIKYDDSYDFDSDGEDEAMFDEYRKELKILFGNIASIDADLVLSSSVCYINEILPNWNAFIFTDIEVAIYLLQLLSEFIPPNKSGDYFSINDKTKKEAFTSMMQVLCSSGVSRCPHPLVVLRYFETVVRYEKFFNQNQTYLPDVLLSFLDERGLCNSNSRVTSRLCYLMSRFIKVHKSQVKQFTEQILTKLQSFLEMPTPESILDRTKAKIAPNDQMFIYETAGILIVSSDLDCERKQCLFRTLLSPVLSNFNLLIEHLIAATDQNMQYLYASCIKHAIDFVSRTSKAFSVSATMATNGCVGPFTEITAVFLGALGLPDSVTGKSAICTAVRGFLHRMVICLDEEVLPYIPLASQQLLRNAEPQDIHDFFPLLNQLFTKFKSKLLPFLSELLPPLVSATLQMIRHMENDSSTKDPGCLAPLRRSYFSFIYCLISSDLHQALACQPTSILSETLLSLTNNVQCLTDDPSTQKLCVSCVRMLVLIDSWSQNADFCSFLSNSFIPVCLNTPKQNEVSLCDAQTCLFINEIAQFLIALKEKLPELALAAIQTHFPSNIAQQLVSTLSSATAQSPKPVNTFLKNYYESVKSN